MRNCAFAALIAVAGLAAGAHAQPQVFSNGDPVVVTYVWSMTKVSTTTLLPVGNQLPIGPGEAARFEVRASYSVPPGTAVTFSTSLLSGSSGAGFLRGFWAGAFDLVGDGGAASAQGDWRVISVGLNALGVRFPYDAAGAAGNGSPSEGGARLRNVQPALFTPSVEGIPSSNPTLAMWRGVWTPADYTTRTVSFAAVQNSVGIWPAMVAAADANGLSLPVPANTGVDFGGSLAVQIVPGPSVVSLLGLAALAAGRRRRPA